VAITVMSYERLLATPVMRHELSVPEAKHEKVLPSLSVAVAVNPVIALPPSTAGIAQLTVN